MEKQLKSTIMMWVLSTLFLMLTGLVGVVYSSVDKKIDTKADKAQIETIQRQLDIIKAMDEELIRMHLSQGYK